MAAVQTAKAPRKGEQGDPQAVVWGSIINTVEYNDELKGLKAIKQYNQMRLGDATVKASLLAVTLPILSAHWYIQPASQEDADLQIAKDLEKMVFEDMTTSFPEFLYEVLLYLPFGRYMHEIIYDFDRIDGFIGVKEIVARPPETIYEWHLDDTNPYVVQNTTNGEFKIFTDKMLMFTHQREGRNFEGVSILRGAYKHWYIKEKLYIIDAIAAERQGLGIPVAKIPTGSTPAQEAKMIEVLKNIRANEQGFATYPDKWVIEWLDTRAGTLKNLMPAIQHHDRQIMKNVLAQFLELGSNSVGSFALSQDHSQLFLLSLTSIADYVKDVINKGLIHKLAKWNWNPKEMPKLEVEKIGRVDANALTTALQRAIQAKVLTPTPDIEDLLRDVMDLAEKPLVEDIDPSMGDPLIAELESGIAQLMVQEGMGAAAGIDEDITDTDAQDPEAVPDEEVEAAEQEVATLLGSIMVGGQPLSEEHKRKISEALKKNGAGKPKKGKGKGKKAVDPKLAEKKAEISKLNLEVKEYKNNTRRMLLEKRAKGEKITPEEKAKIELDLFNKSADIGKKIDTLKSEIDQIKVKQTAPAATDKKASDNLKNTLLAIDELVGGFQHEKTHSNRKS